MSTQRRTWTETSRHWLGRHERCDVLNSSVIFLWHDSQRVLWTQHYSLRCPEGNSRVWTFWVPHYRHQSPYLIFIHLYTAYSPYVRLHWAVTSVLFQPSSGWDGSWWTFITSVDDRYKLKIQLMMMILSLYQGLVLTNLLTPSWSRLQRRQSTSCLHMDGSRDVFSGASVWTEVVLVLWAELELRRIFNGQTLTCRRFSLFKCLIWIYFSVWSFWKTWFCSEERSWTEQI